MEKINTLSLTELIVLIVFILICAFLVYYYWKNVVIPMNEYHKKRMERLVKERKEYEKIERNKELEIVEHCWEAQQRMLNIQLKK